MKKGGFAPADRMVSNISPSKDAENCDYEQNVVPSTRPRPRGSRSAAEPAGDAVSGANRLRRIG